MPEPTTVWMVQLELSPDDVEGTLVLDDDALRFTAADGGRTRTIGLVDIRKVKRIFGSPVLLVHSQEGSAKRATAFYFSQPPPLHPESNPVEPPTLMGPFNRSRAPSKRKQHRTNAGYLASASSSVGDELREWVRATKAAIAVAGGR